MLIVDPEKRYTIEQCLSHPWLTQNAQNVNDSTGGLVGGIAGLEVKRRAPNRERTLLASINSVEVTAQLGTGEGARIKVFAKNKRNVAKANKESAPDGQRAPREFMEMGGKGDQQLFADDSSSVYPVGDAVAKGKKKGKATGQ
ncbi:hypothetical protein G6O67_007178 [Ophiocordyceps sinensis]|nr:hypothetical protein G6O67_007178 [Ophiocordyceps sinensis]